MKTSNSRPHRWISAPFRPFASARPQLSGLIGAVLLLGFVPVNLRANSEDFNNDGKADILFQNKTTRLLNVWFMNGTSLSYTAHQRNCSSAD